MNRFYRLLLVCICIPVLSIAQGWDEQTYRQIEQSIQQPVFGSQEVMITKFGAKPDATAAQNQKAIQKAIDRCSKKGGGRVIVPAGQHFLTGAIRLKSHVNLHVEEGAVLEFAFQPELYPIVETSWEGLDCYNLSPCVYAFQATDIAVTGKGTIDGGGSNETWWPWCGSARFGWKEGSISQKGESRPRLLRNGEDGVPMTDAKGNQIRPSFPWPSSSPTTSCWSSPRTAWASARLSASLKMPPPSTRLLPSAMIW